MKIALVYLDVPNYGDMIIHDTARYLVERILAERGETDVQLVDVSIDSFRWRQSGVQHQAEKSLPLIRKCNALLQKALSSRRLYRLFPGFVENQLCRQWRMKPSYKYYAQHERPKLKEADLILFCGGGLIKFHQQNFHYYLDDITRLAQETGADVVFNAVGVEGYSARNPECILLKKAINRPCVKMITCRDDYASLVRDYKVNPDVITKPSCDPAFWAAETYQASWEGRQSGVIGLNVIRPNIFKEYMYRINGAEFYQLYHDLAQKIVSLGYRAEFFCNGTPQDKRFIEQLYQKHPDLQDMRDVSVFEPENATALVHRIAQYERFMAVRLHASIVGTVMGIPNVSLVWNKKQPLFGEQVGLPENYLLKADFNADTICERLFAARSYQMDEAYKQTVFDNLKYMIEHFGRR